MNVLLAGSIVTIVMGFLIALKLRPSLSDRLIDFERRDNLFTATERSFLGALELALNGRYRVFANVCLTDLVILPKEYRTAAKKMIHQKHVDFVVCTAVELAPVGVCELNDRSRRRLDRPGRDELVERVLAQAGIPVLQFAVQKTYNVQEIRTRLEKMMHGKSKLDEAAVPSQEITPLNPVLDAIMNSIPVQTGTSQFACPKCSAVMVKRLAVKEHSFGKYFWACSTFPKCRQIVEIEEG